MLIGIVGIGFAVVKGSNVKPVEITEEQIAEARNSLSATDATTVDRVYAQYVSYRDYKATLQNYFSGFLFTDDDITNYVQKTTIYALTSKVYGSDNIITQLSLTPEVYAKARSIIPDEEAVSNIYSRITFSSGERESLTLSNDGGGMVIPDEYIIRSYVIAKSYDQCDELQAIVDEAIKESMRKIKTLDPDATLVIVGDNYTDNLSQWIIDRQNDTINKLNNVENTIKNFNNNQVKNLSAEQNHYYELLVARDADQPMDLKSPSKKKFLVFGAAIGFVLSCCYYALKYLLDGTIKTKDEICSLYGMPVLNTVAVTGRKVPLFDRIIRTLRGIGKTETDESIDLIASDIGILMEKSNSRSLYVIQTSKTEEETLIAESLKNAIMSENKDYSVVIGTPVSDSKALKDMASSDNVVLLTDLRKTKKATTDRYYDLFERYDSNVFGSVVIARP